MKRLFLFVAVALFFGFSSLQAQTGITVGPPRNYFITEPGATQTEKILVSNPSKNTTMSLVVSFKDWMYSDTGQNQIEDPGSLPNSLSNWINVMPQTFFTLGPGEAKELEITLTAPDKEDPSNPVHTSLLFITQTNATDSFNEKGALIKVSVRTGVKLYHRFSTKPAEHNLEFTNFKFNKDSGQLVLSFTNTGNIWTDGTIKSEVISQTDGTIRELQDEIIYTMPGDKRDLMMALPEDLKKGKYIVTSTFSHVDNDIIKMAELTFTYE